MPYSLSEFAAREKLSRERIRQLVAEGRIKPAPQMIPFGPKSHVYIFADSAKKVGKDGKRGWPKGRSRKTLDKAK